MSNTYFLNGSTALSASISLNGGDFFFLEKLDFQNPTNPTAEKGLAADKGPGVLGFGINQVVVNIDNQSTTWKVELVRGEVNIALDVQFIVFENALQPRNTTGTDGIIVNKVSQAEERIEVRSESVVEVARRRPPQVPAEEQAADLSFSLIASNAQAGLYAASNNGPGGDGVALTDYYLFLDAGQEAPQALSLQDSFDQAGAYVFLDDDVDPEALLAELGEALSREATTFSRLAWRLAASSYQVVEASVASAVSSDADFPIGTWRLLLRTGARLELDSTTPAIRLLPAGSGGVDSLEIQVTRNGIPQRAGSLPDEILLPLAGTHRGSFTLAWDWQHYELGNDFGGNLRVFYGASAEAASVAQYPFFVPAPDPGPRPTLDLFFDIYMQPLATLNDRRTRLALNLDQPNKLTSNYLSSTTNASLYAEPVAPMRDGLNPGFSFAKNTGLQESDRYLCPVGEYAVKATTGAAVNGNGSNGNGSNGNGNVASSDQREQVRAGLAATEYVLAEPGDRLLLQSSLPAFAKNYQPEGGKPTSLDAELTTSWTLVLRQGNGAEPAADVELVDTSYCAQASESSYFGSDLNPQFAYPIAVGASLVQFSDPENEVLFPMLPYGGVFFEDETQGIPNPNPDLSAQDLTSIEQQVVSPDRRGKLEPFFDKIFGPIFFDTSNSQAFDGGFARTPLGLLAGLNRVAQGNPPAGTINSIILARSPQIPDQFLALNAGDNGVVNPDFSNTTLSDNLFLVATDADAFAPFQNEIKLGDFTFQINLGDAENEAIGLFKFMPGITTRQLIEDSDTWTTLIGQKTPEKIALIQTRLEAALKEADEGGDLFADFRRIIDDPNWNGLLFINCPLDYEALPLDIQILLGGIKGQLLAHHFGITINRVAEDQQQIGVDFSSLFSVIHYQEDFASPPKFPDFQVLLLNIRYANSKLAVFDSQIAFSIDKLFLSPVTLEVAPPTDFKDTGTIVIDGVYTLYEDGTGSLVFSTKDQRSFGFDADDGVLRVLTYQSVTEATLVPLQRQREDGAILAISAFQLDGLLSTKSDIGGDLFSYGKVESEVPSEGLAIADYAFGMTTKIVGNDADLIRNETELRDVNVDQALSRSRDMSFEQTFPSFVQQVSYNAGGLSPDATGEWQLKVSGSEFEAAPVYSLEFNVPMGILGFLLSLKTDLTAQVFVGWVPGKSASESDQIGLILRLPPEVSGPGGFQFQGIIRSSFESAQLNRLKLGSSTGGEDEFVYLLLFVHYQGYLLNLLFNYSIGPKDLGFFGGPSDPGASNSLFFVGKSVDPNWNGPQVNVLFEGVPSFFLGRSYRIETDPTNPNVINEVFNKLNPLTDKTVAEFAQLIFANASLYNSDAGIAFALKFSFKSLALTAVLHDSTFYGAQIKLTPEKKDEGGNGGGGTGGGSGGGGTGGQPAALLEAIEESLQLASTALTEDEDEEKKGGFLSKIQDFTFTIIYRKVSDEVGVWSADIYLNLGQIPLGIFMLSLPNFSISIWTNGDWRFAIGWPFTGATAHPIVVQFQAGPVPVIVKAGFYLGKLSSAAAPEQFGDEFKLIWTFGAGLSGGVGKEFKEGPLQAGASLTLGLTFEGFLGSFNGTFTEDGVDYWWWGISLSLTGNVFGKVDFVVIAVDVSITITITLAFAIETKHSTPLTMNVEVKVSASIKILFVRVSFSFTTKLDLFSFTFGSGPLAKLSGPTPTAVLEAAALDPDLILDLSSLSQEDREKVPREQPLTPEILQQLRPEPTPEPVYEMIPREEPFMTRMAVEEAIPLDINFVLQTTSISTDGSVWTPQGVSTLVLETSDLNSPFGRLSSGLAEWLIGTFGGGGSFEQQLQVTAIALDEGLFNDRVNEALSQTFVFKIGQVDFPAEAAVSSLPMPPTLGVRYNEAAPMIACDGQARATFGARGLPANYTDLVLAYFRGETVAQHAIAEDVEASVAEMIFNEYFVLFAQQLIQLLIETGADNLEQALKDLSLGDLSGFVSRFLMGGLRIPNPQQPSELEAVYVLTGQQFALEKKDGNYVLEAELVAGGGTPSWIEVAANTTSSLEPDMVHTTGPSKPPWALGQLRPLSPEPIILPLNENSNWTDGTGGENLITKFSEDIEQKIGHQLTALGHEPWLVQQLQGSAEGDQQVDLADSGTPWESSAALYFPVRLAGIPDPSGDPGVILPNVFSLLGTDEANRTLLQALLDDSDVDVSAVDLLASPSRGNWTSTKTPNVLVRTDLSTSNAPGLALVAVAEAAEGGGDHCVNYAKPGEGGDQLLGFLRLVWEVSVVHSNGFYLQVEGLDLSMFDNGPADLMLLVRFGPTGSTLQAKTYQNALVGAKPEDGKAIFTTLASDANGTPIPTYASTYPGGSVGWSIDWQNAPAEGNASGTDFLQSLYQMVSYRVEKVNGTPVTKPWSRPVTAQDESPEGSASTTWRYERAFETATLVGSDNRYGAIDDTLSVRISVEDIFGNTFPPALQSTVDLDVLYNDDILGLGNWAGTQAYYLVQDAGSGVQLDVELGIDASVVQNSDGEVDPDQLARTQEVYHQILDQLQDPNLSAGISTDDILAAGLLKTLVGGDSLVSGLVGYIQAVVTWLDAGATGTPPAPVTLGMSLDKTYPQSWPGDLQELVVTLILARKDVPDDIAQKSPEVRQVNSPIQPIEEIDSSQGQAAGDPSGLTTFADGLETAYFPFDGNEGVVKVATGINSEIGNVRFGSRNIYLQRWSESAGTAVEILNDEDNPPIFYAPPSLSQQLISREVDGLRDYAKPTAFVEIDRIFNSIDLDLWASNFLSAVETIFSPQLAPSVADNSSPTNQLYDPFVDNKESLAGTISDGIEYVYVEPDGTGDPPSAKETWRQALLRTLENDYGFSTLTQLKALVTLHGEIEPGGDPNNPPQLYGAVQAPGDENLGTLPYSLTPATLPLVQGTNWLNFLVSAQDPAAQRAFTLDLDYEVNQLEHLRDGDASACGYTPSSWLTFILQQNPESLPQGQDNTLTQPIGTTRIPIPLRTFPPLPKLLQSSATQLQDIAEISQALQWNYDLTVERSRADQDTLNLSLTFNLLTAESLQPSSTAQMASGRPAPTDLFDALARFAWEYPQLESYIDQLPDGGGEESITAVQEFSDLIAGVANTWGSWVPPNSSIDKLAKVPMDGDLEIWNFAIQDVENSENLEVLATWNRKAEHPPFPMITGYTKTSENGNKAIYEPDSGTSLQTLQMSWKSFYILDYQNVRPSAYTERNRNLAPEGQETNPNFIYRTETVAWPTPIVPLVSVPDLLILPSESTLQEAVLNLLTQLSTPPDGSITNGTNPLLALETSIDYRYQVLAQKNETFSLLPVFLLDQAIADGQEPEAATEIADNLSAWQSATGAQSPQSSLRFLLSVFATTIVTDKDRLPLVQFPGLVIPVPGDGSGWW